jgi:glycosyltransferase involved in cell wall biosynthesis
MVTIEAMASGIPVIATNDGGTVSLVNHGRNGLLVTPKNVDELAEAMLRLIEHPNLAHQLAETARREAVVRYSHTAQCEAWETLLGELTA